MKYTKQSLIKVLDRNNGNMARAGKELGITRQGMADLVRRYEICIKCKGY